MSSLVRRCALPLSVTIAAGALVALPAEAAPTWVAAVEVQNDGLTFAFSPVVAVDAEGAATMVWVSLEGSDSTVLYATHPVGGTWSTPDELSAPGAVEAEPDLAVDAAGDAVAVWTQDFGAVTAVQAATRPAGGFWSGPVTLSDATADADQPSVGIDGSGNAVALWSADLDGTDAVVGATKSLGGAWSGLYPLSDPENGAGHPMVAVAPNGGATAVWTHFDPTALTNVVETASRPSAADAFGSSEIISPTTAWAGRPAVAVNAAGAATAAWEQDTVMGFAVHAATRTTAGDWSDSDLVSEPADDPTVDEEENGNALVVLDAAGTSTVVWRRHIVDGSDHQRTVDSASATAGGDWSNPLPLGASSSNSGLGLAIDPTGSATVAWPSEGLLGQVSVARRAVNGTWTGPVPIESGDGRAGRPAVAASPAGDVVVGYEFEPDATSSGILYARAFDVAGPLVRSLSIPATGTAGQPIAFSAAPADAWSSVASTVWSFGDGTTASGAGVSHAYAAVGTYAVTVTVTDAAGNVSTRSGSTVVAAAPVVVTSPAATPKPALTGVRLTKKTIHVVGSDESPRATKVKLRLNADARVVVKLKRTEKIDGKAVNAKTAKALHAGKGAIRLASKVGGKKLPPGIYQVTVRARNAAGFSATKTLKLTIVR